MLLAFSQVYYRFLRFVAVLPLLLVFVALGNASEEDAAEPTIYNPYSEVLSQRGVAPTLEGVTAYLDSLVPDEAEQAARRQRCIALIEQLGDSSYQKREEAMLALMKHPDVPGDLLQSAAKGADPEVAWRAGEVLENLALPDPLPEAVLRTIGLLQIEGAAESILRLLPHLAKANEAAAARDALAMTVTGANRPALRELLTDDDLPLRLAAITALGRVADADDLITLQACLTTEHPEIVRLTAGEALAERGERCALPVLVELLDSADVDTSVRAASLLRAATGEQFGFIAYDDQLRAAAIKEWRTWLAEYGDSVELIHPLEIDQHAPMLGHTLVLVYTTGKLQEYDAADKKIWEVDGLQNPWAVERLPNGHTLVGSYRGKYVVEYDHQRREVWRAEELVGGVFGVQRLQNGNTVLACHDSNQVIEINRNGETVWSHKFHEGQPLDAQRLPNGNTLVALYQENRVAEISRDGKLVWEVTGLGVPRAVRRLANGNTLVVDDGKNRIDEFSPTGESVWSYTELQSPYDVQRLPNGDTLITDGSGVRIVDQHKKTKWKMGLSGVGRALRF